MHIAVAINQRVRVRKGEFNISELMISSKGISINRQMSNASAFSISLLAGIQCKLTTNIEKIVTDKIELTKYKNTISTRVNRLGTIANTMITSHVTKPIIAIAISASSP